MKKFLLSLLCLLAVGFPSFAADVTFSMNDAWSPALPTTSTTTASTHTYNGQTITIYAGKTQKNGGNTAILLAKNSGYVQLPTFSQKVASIKFYSLSGASAKAVVNLYEGDSTTSLGSATTTNPSVDNGYTISIAADKQKTNVAYRLKPTSTANAQISKIEVTFAVAANTVATPAITPSSKEFGEAFDATITCATEGASIYYTTDDSAPTTSSTLYNGPVSIPAATTTLKAIAVKSGMDNSAVAEAVYTYVDPTQYQCANIAEWLTKAAADTSHAYTITGTVTVSYNNNAKADNSGNQYTYVQDASGSLLVFQKKNTLTPGQTLTGLSGNYGEFAGLIEMMNSNIASLTPGSGVAPTPATMAVGAISASDMNKYVKIENANFNPTAKTLTQDGSSIAVYYRFGNVTAPSAVGNYDVEGFVSINNGTLQIYPTKFTEVAQEANISWSAESVNFTWVPNYAAKLPTLNNPDNVAVTYASSNTELATIDATGKVTLVRPGEVTISATAGTKTVSYKLTVGVVNMIAQQLITWEGATDLKYTATIGADNTFPTIKIAEGYNLIGTVYDAFAQTPAEGFTGNVATINADGQITLVNPGTCRIGYIWGAGNPFIGADNFNYELTVLPAAVTSNVAWSATSAQVTFNSAGNYTLPTLSNPDNVAVTYASSDTNIATIDATGKVTVLKPGSTTISAKYGDNKEATYALVIDKIHFTVTFSGLTNGAFTAIMGQTNNYPVLNVQPAAEVDPYWFGVVYQSSNTDVATIAPDGTVTLNGFGETDIRIVNGGNDYVMGDNYPAYKLIVVAGQADLQTPMIEAYMSRDFAAIENGGSIAQTDAPVYISVENPNADTFLTVYVMKAPSADDLDNLEEFETVENFSGTTWNATKFPKEPGYYYISAMVMNADMSKDAYAEFAFTIEGDVVKTYVDPIVDFLDADGEWIDADSAEAPVTFSIENQNPSGQNTSIYYFITTAAEDPAYIKSDENVEVTLDEAGTYRYSAYIATYNGDKLTGTSKTVTGTFTVIAAKPKEATFAATDKDGATVAAGATVAENKAPVTVTVTNPNAGTTMEISTANLSNGTSKDYTSTDATYTLTFDKSGEYAIGVNITKGQDSAYAEFSFTIDGEIEYELTPAYVEFLDEEDNEVESPATKLPINMVISNQNYYEGVEMVYTINGEEKVTTEHEVTITLTEPGTIDYSVICRLGTKSKSTATTGSFEITADAVKLAAPAITFTTPEGETEPVTVTITNPNLNGIGTILYSIGTSAWFEGEGSTVTFTLPNDGVYTIRAYVRNNNNEELSSDITTAEYTLDGIESIGFGTEGVKVIGGHIMAPEGAEVYSINGLRVNTLDRVANGIYIVRLSNGTTTKVIVK